MATFEISIKVPDPSDPLSDANLDALHAAGCDYATFSTHGDGLLMACFDMDGDEGKVLANASRDMLEALVGAEIVKAVSLENER